MLNDKSIQLIGSINEAEIPTSTAPCKTGNFVYPVFSVDDLGEISPECIQKMVNRMIKTDYRNRANRPENLIQVRRDRFAEIQNNHDLSPDEKLQLIVQEKLIG